VHPDYLRFDFTHYEKLTPEQLREIEHQVNSRILDNIGLESRVTSFDKAKAEGATALFGEKYGDEVRVVQVGGYSKELCGGTHVNRTGDIGLFKILSETSISSGVRRIVAITGDAVETQLRKQEGLLEEARKLLNCTPEELPRRIELLQQSSREMEKELARAKESQRAENLDELLSNSFQFDGYEVVAKKVTVADRDGLENYGDLLRNKLQTLNARII
ncbi:MAG: alanine--tRNA ligase, partial [Calditrichota bacterium]